MGNHPHAKIICHVIFHWKFFRDLRKLYPVDQLESLRNARQHVLLFLSFLTSLMGIIQFFKTTGNDLLLTGLSTNLPLWCNTEVIFTQWCGDFGALLRCVLVTMHTLQSNGISFSFLITLNSVNNRVASVSKNYYRYSTCNMRKHLGAHNYLKVFTKPRPILTAWGN